MKKNYINRAKAGFTIVEVTLVLSIILGLAALLFLGLSAYKQGSDKARCVLQLSTVQKSVRSAANLDSLNIGDALPTATLTTEGYFTTTLPLCPKDGSSYTYDATVPAIGTAYATCVNGSLAGNLAHAPTAAQLANW